MTEVTKSNFKEMFPRIEKAITNSSFVAIDTEFTGLDLGSTNDSSLFDSLDTRYQKLKLRASNFLPCQIGLSLFRKGENENVYLMETYVFFVRPYMCGGIDRRFMCQTSCLDFLCKYDFDFNKFIKEGIPYLNENEEEQILKEIRDGTVGFSYEKFVGFQSRRKLDMLIDNMIKSSQKQSLQVLLGKEAENINAPSNILLLEKETTCHEYFQINELRRRYPLLCVYSKNDKIFVEHSPLDKIKEQLQQNVKNEENSLLDYYLGFTKVFRVLQKANKPIVGHNLLMDLLLFYQNFYKPLPETYKQFKAELHNVFPVIFDTRHIWLNVKKFYKLKEIPLQCGLFDLFEMFKNPTDSLSTLYSPEVEHVNCDKYRVDEFPHESGFDSFVTGWVFLKISHVLSLNKISNPVFIQPQTFKQYLKALSPFQNKINMSRSNVRYIDLEGDDPIPKESQLLHISAKKKNKELSHVELSRLFDKYGMVEFKLNSNKREAILAIGNLRSFREILKDFENDADFLVSKYSAMKHSSIVNTALWLVLLGGFSVAAFCGVKIYSRT